VLEHYEEQTEDEAALEDEAAFKLRGRAVMVVPKRLVPEIARLIERRRSRYPVGSAKPHKAVQQSAHGMRHIQDPSQ
jgi:hypothetical protein